MYLPFGFDSLKSIRVVRGIISVSTYDLAGVSSPPDSSGSKSGVKEDPIVKVEREPRSSENGKVPPAPLAKSETLDGYARKPQTVY